MDSSVEQSGLKVDWPIGLCAEDLARYGDSVLSDREREALSLRFGVDGAAPKTLREVGECLGVGLERARQVIDAAAIHVEPLDMSLASTPSPSMPRVQSGRVVVDPHEPFSSTAGVLIGV